MFKDAAQRERDAQRICKQAAALCEDEALKELLEGFRKDEVRHEKALLQPYNRLRRRYDLQDE
jgi:rubrerythrin